MAELIGSVSRTQIKVAGKVEMEKLSEKFEQLRGDKRITMIIDYDERSNTSTIKLSPCRILVEEYAKKKVGDVCCRVVISIDRLTMAGIGNGEFYDAIWHDFKKGDGHYSITGLLLNSIPDMKCDSNAVFCELSGTGAYRDKKNVSRAADADVRNKLMLKAKRFLMEELSKRVENDSSIPAARELDIISSELAEEIFGAVPAGDKISHVLEEAASVAAI